MHTLVIGLAECAQQVARRARRDPGRDVTMIRGADDPADDLISTGADPEGALLRLTDAGIAVELHTRATFIDADNRTVWVESAGREEAIAYDELVVCAAVDEIPPGPRQGLIRPGVASCA